MPFDVSPSDIFGPAPAQDMPRVGRVFLDFETFSKIDLRKTGVHLYAKDPSTEAMMLAYAINRDPVQQWNIWRGDPMPDDLKAVLEDDGMILSAWNAAFEIAIFRHVLGLTIPLERWRCTMVMAMSLSLPGKLEKAGMVMGLPEDKAKMSRGTALIRKFCVPRKPTKMLAHRRADEWTDPDDWKDFLLYNRQDIEAERSIYYRLRRWDMPAHEWRLWHIDQRINERGMPINMRAVREAIKLRNATVQADMARMKVLTGLDNPNSPKQLLPWLRARGYPYLDLKKGHVEQEGAAQDALADDPDGALLGHHPVMRKVLAMRLRTSKASVKKYDVLTAAVEGDGRLRGCFQFCGAGRTWRWAGRRLQPQNLPRPDREFEDEVPELVAALEHVGAEGMALLFSPEQVMKILVALIRPMVQAPRGTVLCDADLNAIENRVLGWLADDTLILQVFEQDRDPYIAFAVYMFNRTYEDLYHDYSVKKDKGPRTIAKPGVLGAGYMLGPGAERENTKTGEIEATGLLGYGRNMGVDLTPEMSEHSVKTFRRTFTGVVQFWDDLMEAVKRVIRTGQPEKVRHLRFDMSGPFLRMHLPSGRCLHYVRPRILPRKTPWGEVRPTVTYENLDKGQWKRVSTHPGKLAENATQAVARDLLAHGLVKAEEAGLETILHVHDQIVTLCAQQGAERDEELAVLIAGMTDRPAWADAKLPLAAAGGLTPVFLKD